MKKTFFFFLLLSSLSSFSQWEETDPRILNEFIVMLKPNNSVNDLLRNESSLRVKKILSKRMNIVLLERNTTTSADEFLFSLQKKAEVKLAQFNHKVKERSLIPNDTRFNEQWNMLNTGQNSGLAGADIDATDAWAIDHSNLTVNGDTIVLAIVDGKFDLSHEDINFFKNYNETPSNSIDEDGNGFIDDFLGWSVVDTSDNVNTTSLFNSHSTHCAGVAAAIGNNGKGIAGVCWGAQIMAIDYGNTDEASVVAAYDYVREMRMLYNSTFGTKGAFVVTTSNSFGVDGGPGGQLHTDFPIWCAMYDSMGAVGILSAGATANQGWDVDTEDDTPTGCPSDFLVAVTNTNRSDVRNSGAAYGKMNVDIGAPGSSVLSCIPGNNYFGMSGTSMATPHVAGAIGAMYAAACKPFIDYAYEHPDSAALLVRKFLLEGAEWISSMNNITSTSGRLNLLRAVTNIRTFCDSCNFSGSISKTIIACKNTDNGALSANITGSGIYSYLWSNGDTTANISNLAPGFYVLTVTDGNSCIKTFTAELHYPDDIVIASINTIPADTAHNGNIIVNASAGYDTLSYSLDGVNWQSSSTFVIPSNGNYTVYVKNLEGCITTQNVFVNGISDLEFRVSDFNLFPNPANNILNLKLNLSSACDLKISVTDVLGRTVLGEKKNFSSGVFTHALNISSLASSVYFITLESGKEKLVRKFVVSK